MKPRDGQDVEDITRDCSLRAQKGEFAIVYTAHARERMEQRSITEKEVEAILEFGKVQEGQEKWSEKEKDYSYLIRDQNLDGRDMALAIGINEDSKGNKVIIVTAELIDPKTGAYL